MLTWQTTRQQLTRTALLATIVASLAVTTATGAGAETASDPSRDAATEIQICEAMGGEAEVTVDRTSTTLTVIVECNGGALDGFNCINDMDFTPECAFTRFVPGDRGGLFGIGLLGSGLRVLGDIGPRDEPTATPAIVAVEEPIVLAPIEEDVFVSPTPAGDDTGTEVVVADPAVSDDEVAPEPTATSEGEVIIEPVVDDGAVAEEIGEAESGDKPMGPEVHVGVEDIAPVEAVILT